MIRLFASTESDFTHNQYILKNALSCEVNEEENGIFDLTLEYPINSDIQEEAIIKAPTPRGEQPFVIEKITKTLKGYKAYAVNYAGYKLKRNFLDDVRPTNLSCQNAGNYLLSHSAIPMPFTCTSDILDSKTAYYVRINPLEAFIGAENSILNNYGGYMIRNGMNIHIMKEPKDIGYEIRMGKNLLGVVQEIDVEGVITKLYPTAVLEDNTIAILPEEYVDSPYVLNYAQPVIRELVVTLTTEEKTLSTPMIYEIMRAKANEEFAKGIDLPKVNYKIDFVELSKITRMPYKGGTGLAQYTHEELSKNTHAELSLSVHGVAFGDPTDILAKMNELDICHMVDVYIPKLNIYVKARIIKYSYDAIKQRFNSIELGDYKPMERYMTQNILLNMNRNLKLKANQTSIDTPTHVLTENGFELKDSSGGLLMNKYGSVNNDNFSSRDNVEEGFPLWIPFEVDTDVSSIKRVTLWWKNFPYRATAKNLAGGGGGVKTTLGGGGGAKTTLSGGGSTSGPSSASTTTAKNWGGAYVYTGYGVSVAEQHLHILTMNEFDHEHDMAHEHETKDHIHTLNLDDHLHTLELEDHIHELVFGIVETPITDDTFTIWIDGTERMTVNARTGKQDITEWIQTVGDHEIELRSPTKKLIHANVSLKTYIRG